MTHEEDDNREPTSEPTEHMINNNESGLEIMEDQNYMTYILFYSLGTLTLVPANFFTTATDYWMYKFRDTKINNYSTDNRTGLQAQFTADYSIVSNVSNVAFLIFTFLVLRKLALTKRLLGAQCGILIMFALTVLFVEINTDTWQTGFFVLTLITGFFLTACSSVFMASLFQLVAKFPPKYLPIILNGQSICGIFSALVQICSLSLGASSKTNGLVYFLVGMFFVFMTLLQFLVTLKKSKFFQHYLELEIQTEKPNITKEAFISVLNKIKFYIISMIIVLGCSIMIHPGVTSLVVSKDKGNGNKWNDVYFVPVGTFLLYNIFDYLGRECAGFLRKPRNGMIIFALSFCRIAFVPMLMMCNEHPRHHLPVVFNDCAYIIFIIIFSFSNGFLVNLCIIQVPSVTKPEEKLLSIILILVLMIISLGACSFISAALINAL